MPILRVALDVPVNTLFDYLGPDTVVTEQDVGTRVRVPFGKHLMTGVIMEVATYSSIASPKLKPIAHIFRDVPPLPETLLDLFRFCSAYYHHPLGEVVMNGLPGRLRSSKPFVQQYRPILEYRLTGTGRAADPSVIPPRNIVKRRLLARLKETGSITIEEAKQLSQRAPGVLKEFASLWWVEERAEIESSAIAAANTSSPVPVLTPAQKNAVDEIVPTIKQFNTWLLHGVTGSGKTEVYLRLITLMLHQRRQTLVLVPEINLTPQLEAVFRARFPAIRLISLHSGLNPSERAGGWLQAQRGDAQIILGTRLAVFTPLPDLGLIIVDEEQDMSFKQQDGLRYSARDVAIFRARQTGVPVILGSATPSLETYYNAINGRYLRLQLPSRAVRNATLPLVRCIDTRIAKTEEGLSPPLISALETSLALNQQSLVFINRRGYAPVLLCRSCAWTAACQRCASRLVVHLREKKLRCHHCGHQERFPTNCPECGDQDIAPFGHGTQRVEEALSRRFPHARIMRIDRDSTRRKDAWQKMLEEIQGQRVDILIGTQILAKGHDFPNLSLVSVLNSDASLFSSDFRASERLFAQLMQVAGRAGRGGIPGQVLIQTEFPNHPLYQALCRHDYDSLAQTLLVERKLARFPPFIYQVLLWAEAPSIDLALAFLANAEGISAKPKHIEIFDPVPAQMPRLKGMERAYLLVQSSSRSKLQKFLGEWRTQLDALPDRKVRWALDVDPLEF
ncbi:primosomal protein N' [Nitrosovibrio tenuis]|uniref:Replication restart protein PriA n=1 Tax=Nitrosovibrio tenuis TaxID=1233 RepID=A0A1H7ND78_9PROT|nr:primosomal protein N' [Nitrosovibrio tenuis]SEL21546.1 replication restart DNA helicase PriA [Nitrosovibrio tenuis]